MGNKVVGTDKFSDSFEDKELRDEINNIGKYFDLDKDNNVIEVSLTEWGRTYEEREREGRRRVNSTYILRPRNTIFWRFLPYKKYWVSTVFLGLVHGGNTFFETMIFPAKKGPLEEHYCRRYKTYKEAAEGHLDICENWQPGDD